MRKYKILSEAQDNLPQEENIDFLKANTEALASIVNDVQNILSSLEEESVQSHLTEAWLQGKISEAQDYMKTIHDFVKFDPENDDEKNMTPASLWENIRKKKLREGKKYKPAKPGDKDRPNKEAWKRAQNS